MKDKKESIMILLVTTACLIALFGYPFLVDFCKNY